jgi:hypothetical protein
MVDRHTVTHTDVRQEGGFVAGGARRLPIRGLRALWLQLHIYTLLLPDYFTF